MVLETLLGLGAIILVIFIIGMFAFGAVLADERRDTTFEEICVWVFYIVITLIMTSTFMPLGYYIGTAILKALT